MKDMGYMDRLLKELEESGLIIRIKGDWDAMEKIYLLNPATRQEKKTELMGTVGR